MYQFLVNNQEELIARCKQKVTTRPLRSAMPGQLAHGIPIFLDQLTRTLLAEEKGRKAEGTRISGGAGNGARDLAHAAAENRRLGFLVHELRNALSTASVAVSALEMSHMPVTGATGAILKRSLDALKKLIDKAIAEVRSTTQPAAPAEVFTVADFVAEVAAAARLDPKAERCRFIVDAVDPQLTVAGNRGLLSAALGNLLQNAFKFTHPGSTVQQRARAVENRVLIEVEDRCGGLLPGTIDRMFKPFSERMDQTTGLGLGLCIARQSVEVDGGDLSVRNLPDVGCVFTMNLPLHSVSHSEAARPG